MHFSRTLKTAVYEPWKSNYIDYAKLKQLLHEDRAEDDGHAWTEDDESKFVEELVNAQLEKVNAFQEKTYESLQECISNCEEKLEESRSADNSENQQEPLGKDELSQILKELDSISKEINELEKYSRINFTGFLKAAKKHDRRRGTNYKVRPLLQVRLAALPFNSEDYSPLLYRLSAMYSHVRQRIDGDSERPQSLKSETRNGSGRYVSHKFWVHHENLLEVKTYILRRLPVLVYNPQTSKVVQSGQADPTITSLYFDSPRFSLYDKKIAKNSGASSLRLRWFGQLEEKPDIVVEKKTTDENGDSDEVRFPIKEKYIQPFITGDYKMEKAVEKLRVKEGSDGNGASDLQSSIEDLQSFIKDNKLQPVLRANYTRTAFQVPGDNKVRISIDTDLALIREDALDQDRPCRSPDEWHRGDIDRLGLKYPFPEIRQGEITHFPHVLLEIKIKEDASKKATNWVNDLMSSHLLKEEPRFSKFVHGVAVLFEDHVNSFPFWLSDLETDIRKDPETAFQEEQDKKARQAENEAAVGSFIGSKSASSFQRAVGSPAGKKAFEQGQHQHQQSASGDHETPPREEPQPAEQETNPLIHQEPQPNSVLSSLLSLPPFSNSKYARAHRTPSQPPVSLPPGIHHPGTLIKDQAPLKVEPKVWLANQRTFIKWQHVSVLLASLSLGLYNAAGEDNGVARGLAVVYTAIAVFAGGWGWWMFVTRSRMIEERSGRDFDNVLGPVVVCGGLVVALVVNFGFKVWSTLYFLPVLDMGV